MFQRPSTTLASAVDRLVKHQLTMKQMISIGAGSGSDSIYLSRRFGNVPVLMIEAQSEHEPALAQLKRTHPEVDYCLCAATATDGEVAFSAQSLTGGAVVAEGAGTRRVPARRVDSIVVERRLSGPFFLKFDTHGVEVDILQGAAGTLANTSLVMMEVYNFKLNFVQRKNLTFWEMIPYLQERGFRCVDFCDPLFRPGDGVLWQMQMFFIRADHPVFESNSYSAKR
jgi:FkbM family methyltransferase